MVGEVECIWVIGAKTEEKRSLGRPRLKWVDNNKMDLREIGWVGMDCIDLAEVTN
jgi:hypothetical protein